VAIEPVALDVVVTTGSAARRVPTLLFVPRSDAPLPLVLLGHGAHQSKDDPIAQLLGRALARGVPAGVALIDSPGHGERRLADSDEAEYLGDVSRRMADPAGDAGLIADWAAVAKAARAAAPVLSGPLGYAGFSMGALFGLSIVADIPKARAAVFALGGVRPEAGSAGGENAARNARVRDGARRLGDREILMVNMTRDEHFPIAGALEVLELMPGPKRMSVWAGTHEELPPESMAQITAFLARTLAR
jgi:dienelactone hydrolase